MSEKLASAGLLDDLRLPVIYEMGEPVAVVIDLDVFEAIVKRLEGLEDEALFSDPAIVARLQKAREDHLAGRVVSREALLRELGLDLKDEV